MRVCSGDDVVRIFTKRGLVVVSDHHVLIGVTVRRPGEDDDDCVWIKITYDDLPVIHVSDPRFIGGVRYEGSTVLSKRELSTQR